MVDEDNLGGYDFHLNHDLEDLHQMATGEREGEKDMGISFSNLSDLGSDSDSSLYFTLSQIARDTCREVRKKANMKISREIEDKNSNPTIFRDDKEKNEDIFPTQAHILNSARLFYLQAKSQQVSTNTNGEQTLIPSFLNSFKPVVQN